EDEQGKFREVMGGVRRMKKQAQGGQTAASERGAPGNSGATGPGDCPGVARPRTPISRFPQAAPAATAVEMFLSKSVCLGHYKGSPAPCAVPTSFRLTSTM